MDATGRSRGELGSRWAALVAVSGAGDPTVAHAVGLRLLAAYGDPRRGYHDLRHLLEVLDTVDVLAAEAADLVAVRLAAWFHDAVHTAGPGTGQVGDPPGGDEEASAALAEELLAGAAVPADLVGAVVRLVRLTAEHDPGDGDCDGAVLCDADLAVLGRDRAGYQEYVAGVRREYLHVPDTQFRTARAAVLRSLADRPALFRTATARARWEASARANLAAELAQLEAT